MLIFFIILIVSLKDVLSRTHVNRKCVFCILWQYSAEQFDAQFSGKAFYYSIKTISNRNLGFMTFLKKTNVSLPINGRRTSLLELPIKT